MTEFVAVWARVGRHAAIVLTMAVLATVTLALGPAPAWSQSQGPDLEFAYANDNPAYPAGEGPLIALSSLNSPLVQRGSFEPLLRLAQTDGFQTIQSDGPLRDVLAENPDILVIINAYSDRYRDFSAMEPPSAFDAEDMEAVRAWVEQGGSLLLLADHAPFGGGSAALAGLFGFTFLNGHVAEDQSAAAGYVRVTIDYAADNGLNQDHPITNGRLGRRPSDRYVAFGGQGFIPPETATTLLRIPEGWSAIFTYAIRRELGSAPRIDAAGMSQGSVMDYGKGRLAVFAEAGGFSAQTLDGDRRFGFNSEQGADNPEFVLSVLRWLAGYEPEN